MAKEPTAASIHTSRGLLWRGGDLDLQIFLSFLGSFLITSLLNLSLGAKCDGSLFERKYVPLVSSRFSTHYPMPNSPYGPGKSFEPISQPLHTSHFRRPPPSDQIRSCEYQPSESVKAAHISSNTLSRFVTNVMLFTACKQNGSVAVAADKDS